MVLGRPDTNIFLIFFDTNIFDTNIFRKVSGTDEVIVADKTKARQTPEGNYDVTY